MRCVGLGGGEERGHQINRRLGWGFGHKKYLINMVTRSDQGRQPLGCVDAMRTIHVRSGGRKTPTLAQCARNNSCFLGTLRTKPTFQKITPTTIWMRQDFPQPLLPSAHCHQCGQGLVSEAAWVAGMRSIKLDTFGCPTCGRWHCSTNAYSPHFLREQLFFYDFCAAIHVTGGGASPKD